MLVLQTHFEILSPTVDDGRDCTVLADLEDITLGLRRSDVEANVSPVSAMPRVRRILTAQMRKAGLRAKRRIASPIAFGLHGGTTQLVPNQFQPARGPATSGAII
jgi:hypothetical protein